MESMYFEVLDHCVQRPDVRAVVVTGAGRSWCVGADMDVVKTASKSNGNLQTNKRPDPRATATMPIPIIAAINGACAGRGLVQALYCDIRFAARGAKFATSFSRRGLSSEYAISWIMPKIVGAGAAMDLLVSGRTFLAEEAAALGLINKVVEPDDLLNYSVEYAADLAQNCSPTAMAAIKNQVWSQLELGWTAAMSDSRELMEAAVQGPDVREGVASFLEKRPPHFDSGIESWAMPKVRF